MFRLLIVLIMAVLITNCSMIFDDSVDPASSSSSDDETSVSNTPSSSDDGSTSSSDDGSTSSSDDGSTSSSDDGSTSSSDDGSTSSSDDGSTSSSDDGSTSSSGSEVETSDTKPVLTVSGSYSIEKGDSFSLNDISYRATDKEDGDISSDVVLFGNVNTDDAGDYDVTLSVTDSDNNTVSETITVSVVAAPYSMFSGDIDGSWGTTSDKFETSPNTPGSSSVTIKETDEYVKFSYSLGDSWSAYWDDGIYSGYSDAEPYAQADFVFDDSYNFSGYSGLKIVYTSTEAIRVQVIPSYSYNDNAHYKTIPSSSSERTYSIDFDNLVQDDWDETWSLDLSDIESIQFQYKDSGSGTATTTLYSVELY